MKNQTQGNINENVKDITLAETLTHEELTNNYDLLWGWISSEDKTYELYRYLKTMRKEDWWNGADKDDSFYNLFIQFLEGDGEYFDNVLSEYKQKYLEDTGAIKSVNDAIKEQVDMYYNGLLLAIKKEYEMRTDTDAKNVMALLGIIAKLQGIKMPDDSDEVDLLLKHVSNQDIIN